MASVSEKLNALDELNNLCSELLDTGALSEVQEPQLPELTVRPPPLSCFNEGAQTSTRVCKDLGCLTTVRLLVMVVPVYVGLIYAHT